MTNYERIRQLTLEQMSDFLTDISSCDKCPARGSCKVGCHARMNEWLRLPVEGKKEQDEREEYDEDVGPDSEIALASPDEKQLTLCDKCKRHRTCYKEGRLFVMYTLSDMALVSDYNYKGTHGMLKIDEYCPKRRPKKKKGGDQ